MERAFTLKEMARIKRLFVKFLSRTGAEPKLREEHAEEEFDRIYQKIGLYPVLTNKAGVVDYLRVSRQGAHFPLSRNQRKQVFMAFENSINHVLTITRGR